MSSSELHPYKEAGLFIATGIPGSGKSYRISTKQVEWLESGNPVLSNIRITAMPFRLIPKKLGKFVQLDDEDFIEFDRVFDDDGNPVYYEYLDEKGNEKREPLLELKLLRKLRAVLDEYPDAHPLVVIDEAPNYYASQDFKANPKAMKAFLRQHRKLGIRGTTVVAVAQNEGMLDNNFNRLCREYIHHTNLVNDPKLTLFLWWFGDNFHMSYCMAQRGGKPYRREVYGRSFFRIKRKKASLYNTAQVHASGSSGQQRPWKSYKLRMVMGLVGALVAWQVLLFGWRSFRGEKMTDNPVLETQEEFELATLDAVEVRGKTIVQHVLVGGHVRRYDVPLDWDLFYELSDGIGDYVQVPALQTQRFTDVQFKLYEN